MKRCVFFIVLVVSCLQPLIGQQTSLHTVPDNLQVQESQRHLQQQLDSASEASYIRLHAKFYPLSLDENDAYTEGENYFWKLSAEGFGLKAYLKLQIHQNDTLYVHDHTGKLIETLHSGNHFQQQWISKVYNEELVLRYSSHSELEPQVEIEGYSLQLSSENTEKKTSDFGDSDFCEINVNCSEGSNYRDVQKSVVRINIKLNGFEGWCTGTLVNNTAYDFTPYILTAEHCGLTPSNQFLSDSDLERWEFFFYYAGDGCANPASESQVNYISLTGSEFVSRSDDNGGDFGSDFLLLRLTDTILFNQINRPYFAGWNRADKAIERGVTLHHPEGDIKKISTFNSKTFSSEFKDSVKDTHWEVVWSSTANGHGVTEFGSSGCPLLNSQGLVTGVLTGGLATCFANTDPDYYGKFSYSWDQNGSAPKRQLKPWLDPVNSGNFVLNGAYRGDSVPQQSPEGKISLVPNPVYNGSVEVNNIKANQIIDVFLYSLAGKLVLTEPKITIDDPKLDRGKIMKLRNGAYIARIIQNGQATVQKLILANQ